MYVFYKNKESILLYCCYKLGFEFLVFLLKIASCNLQSIRGGSHTELSFGEGFFWCVNGPMWSTYKTECPI